MLKKLVKIVLTALIVQLIFITNVDASVFGNIFSEGENFINDGRSSNELINSAELQSVQNDIYNLLLGLGIVTMVIVGAILGLTYILGSIEQQVKVKESLFPYIIGCAIISSAFIIWKIVIVIMTNIT